MFKAETVVSKKEFSYDMGLKLGEALIEKLGQMPSACWLFCEPGDRIKEVNIAGLMQEAPVCSIMNRQLYRLSGYK